MVAEGFIEKGKTEKAEKLLNEALKAAEKIKYEVYRFKALSYVIDGIKKLIEK